MANDKQQMTVQQWAETQAAAIIQAGKDKSEDTATILVIAGRMVELLLYEVEQGSKASKRLYSNRDVSTLRLAREMLGQGKNTKQIKAELENIIDLQTEEEETTEETALAPIDRRLTDLASQLEQLRQDRAADRARIEALEQQIADLNRPFWKRLLKRP